MIKESMLFLTYRGDCAQALDFYAAVFGAEIVEKTTYGEAEMAETEEYKNRVMNSTLLLGGMKICAGDAAEPYSLSDGNRHSIWLEADSETALQAIYARFQQGDCKVLSELENTFWGSVYAKVEDPFGIQWELNWQP